MGAEQSLSRRKLVAVVEECLGAVNANGVTVEELRTAHNVFTERTKILHENIDDAIASLRTRSNAASAWCVKNEDAIAQLRKDMGDTLEIFAKDRPPLEQITGIVANIIAENNHAIEWLHRVDRERLDALLDMTFWQRLRWLIHGGLPHGRDLVRDFGRPLVPREHR